MAIERIFVISGSSRGIGEALALALAAPDAAVIGLARGHSAALAAVRTGVVEQHPCDAANIGALAPLLARVLDPLPLASARLIALVNNAAMLEPAGQVGTLDAAALDTHVRVNLTAPLALTDAFVRLTAGCPGSRRVLNISSGAGRRTLPGWSAYCATKAGLDHYTRTLADEQAGRTDGVRAVSLAPGVVDTAMQATARALTAEQFPALPMFIEMKATGALAAPAAVGARIGAFLQSDGFGTAPVADLRDLPA